MPPAPPVPPSISAIPAPEAAAAPAAPAVPAAPPAPFAPAGSMMDDILASLGAGSAAPEEIPDCPIAPRELPPGTRLNGYRLICSLGAGGFGVTYLALDEQSRRKVVIKENFPERLCVREARTNNVVLIDAEHRHDYPLALANFLRELHVVATLAHPNMARVYAYFEAHYTVYFVSEYISGMSLGEVMQEYRKSGRRLEQEELYGALVRLLDALHYLHGRRLLHCDIKPDNILINDRGLPMLIDFGAVQEMDAPRFSHMIETPGFSPPEQTPPGGILGPWTDLYALGATFYYLLTNSVLPPSHEREQFDAAVPLAQRAELLERYHPRLLASIDRAIRPAAALRYTSAAEWLADLRE